MQEGGSTWGCKGGRTERRLGCVWGGGGVYRISDVSREAVLAETAVTATVFTGNHRRRALDFDVLAKVAVLVVSTRVFH